MRALLPSPLTDYAERRARRERARRRLRNGMPGVPPLSYGLPGTESTSLSPGQLLAFTVILACIVTLAVRALLQGPFGRVLAGVRENELRTQQLQREYMGV